MTPVEAVIFSGVSLLVLVTFTVGIIRHLHRPAERFDAGVHPVRPSIRRIEDRPPPGTVEKP